MKLQVGRKGYDKGLVLLVDETTSLDLVKSIVEKMKHNRFIQPLGYRFLTLVFSTRISPTRIENYSCSISL